MPLQFFFMLRLSYIKGEQSENCVQNLLELVFFPELLNVLSICFIDGHLFLFNFRVSVLKIHFDLNLKIFIIFTCFNR